MTPSKAASLLLAAILAEVAAKAAQAEKGPKPEPESEMTHDRKREVLRRIASVKYGVGFSDAEIDAVIAVGDAFNPGLAVELLEGICRRYRMTGEV